MLRPARCARYALGDSIMSLSRLALRLAAIEALAPSATASAGPWPTLAGRNVFEERIDLIAQAETAEDLAGALAELENKPVIVVYTEDHHALPYGAAKYPPDENVVTLAIEISLGATGMVPIFDAEGRAVEFGALDAPVTDRQQAAILDMLEDQVRRLFDSRQAMPSAALFCSIAQEIRSIHSDPQRAGDRTLRLALRTIKFHCKVAGVAWPAPGAAPAIGLAALPEPLRTVALALPAGSDSRALCESLAPMIAPAAGLADPLAGVSVIMGVGRLPSSSANADAVISIPSASAPATQP